MYHFTLVSETQYILRKPNILFWGESHFHDSDDKRSSFLSHQITVSSQEHLTDKVSYRKILCSLSVKVLQVTNLIFNSFEGTKSKKNDSLNDITWEVNSPKTNIKVPKFGLEQTLSYVQYMTLQWAF